MNVLTIDKFRDRFFQLTYNWSWEVLGFIDSEKFVYPIDSDTKVISTVFERIAAPALRSVAKEFGYDVQLANQTTYPDFTLTCTSTGHRIALDIKTTYIRQRMVFTLGSYNSFLRNNTKNILYPYDSYSDHWVLGFIYERLEHFADYDLDSLPKPGDVTCPYRVDAIFVREKYEISGLRGGSKNTKNIGSFIGRHSSDFYEGMGPFAGFSQPKKACDFYWANYEKYCPQIKNSEELLSHQDFQIFI